MSDQLTTRRLEAAWLAPRQQVYLSEDIYILGYLGGRFMGLKKKGPVKMLFL